MSDGFERVRGGGGGGGRSLSRGGFGTRSVQWVSSSLDIYSVVR